MSDPYIYRPATSFASGYVNTSYHSPQSSPYIPAATLPGAGSPYHSPFHSPYHSPFRNSIPLPGSPNTSSRVVFPSTGYDNSGYDAVYGHGRQRRPSWHASTSPYLGAGEDLYARDRRRSFGGGGGGSPYAHLTPYPFAWAGGPYDLYAANHSSGSPYGHLSSPLPNIPHSPGQFHLHPWLNAENWRGDFLFDLSSPHFNPQVVLSHTTRADGGLGVGQTGAAPMEHMMQPATVPGLTRLRVVCDFLPKWPVDISYNQGQDSMGGMENPGSSAFRPDPLGFGGGGGVAPITFIDVLMCIHRSLHTRIGHADWAQLTTAEEEAVSRAYTNRCRAAAHAGVFGSGTFGADAEQAERSQGVKRVDFLLGKVWFRGCVVDWGSGVLRLVVT
ncbi:hypothetical protein PQX77_012428 [Marasmius sp. AFHP31]|nr:hypothetical protein PQX77_012428 [Marasmius sp. AFHP31]